MIPQSSSYFIWKSFLIKLLLQVLNEASQSNIFLVFFFFFCIRSSKINSIFIIIRISFLLSKLNIYWFLLFFIVFLQVIVIIFYENFGNWSSSWRNFLWNIRNIVCFCCITTTRSDNSDAISII